MPMDETQADEADSILERDEVVMIETNLDNVTGELLGWLMERLLAAGALDVSYQPLQMKKNRPGTLVRIIARPADVQRLAALVVRETPTLGVRLTPMQRLIAARHQYQLPSPLGPITVKVKLLAGTVVAATAEYDDCQRIALAFGMPLQEVQDQLRRWLKEQYGVEE